MGPMDHDSSRMSMESMEPEVRPDLCCAPLEVVEEFLGHGNMHSPTEDHRHWGIWYLIVFGAHGKKAHPQYTFYEWKGEGSMVAYSVPSLQKKCSGINSRCSLHGLPVSAWVFSPGSPVSSNSLNTCRSVWVKTLNYPLVLASGVLPAMGCPGCIPASFPRLKHNPWPWSSGEQINEWVNMAEHE